MATTGFTLGPLMARMLAETIATPTAASPVPDEFAPDRARDSVPAHT